MPAHDPHPGHSEKPIEAIIVDDDPLFRRYVAHVLQASGFNVRVTSDGPGLRAAVLERLPDVVVLDVVLHHESGLDLCRELRSGPSTADLIILATSATITSAMSSRVDEVRALAAGANSFVPKGRSSDPLVEAVHQALRLRAA